MSNRRPTHSGRLAVAMVALVVGASWFIPQTAGAKLEVLKRGVKPFTKQFNAASDRARFVAILSPT